jgi:ATP-dependent DNA helicase DinG
MTLEDILMPGTPNSVKEAYQKLAQRAMQEDFGLLEQDVIVLDTETTGLSFKDCELIQIAAARIDGREVVDRFETFVHPGRPIPRQIQRLTGIRDLDVINAPEPREAVAALAEFVGGMPVLAHNASFDRTFIEAVPGGREVSDTWIDTLALSRIALPRLSTHRLADMAEAFGVAAVTHRAGDDVDALVGMWRVILTALSDLPHGLLGHLSTMHLEVDWPYRPVLAHLAAEQGAEPFSMKATRRTLVGENPPHLRDDAAEHAGHLTPVDQSVIDAAFEPGGVVARMYDAYETRPEQRAMAREVAEALSTSTHRAIEAGTGVGKSVAYLLPEVLFAQANNVTVGVATKTNALTDQLITHELPALAQALPGGLTFTSLKGYDHYPCLRRLERAAEGELPLSLVEHDGRSDNALAQDMLTAIAVTYAFACQSTEGDLDALGIRWRSVPRSLLTTTSSECLRNRCPFFPNECLLHGARRRAAAADVVVTNHSLLLRNVAAEGKILPPIRHWVVDEAHAFEAEARHQWAVEVSGTDAHQGFEVLGGIRTGALHTVMIQAVRLEGATLLQRLLTKCASAASRAQVSTSDLFVTLHDLGRVAGSSGGYDAQTLWIDAEVRDTPEWAALSEAGNAAVERLDELAKDVREAVEALAQAGAPQLGADLTEAGRFAAELRDGIDLIVGGQDETYVYSAQLSRRKRDMGTEKLLAEKVDIGADLGSIWLPEMQSVIFSSATIAVGESFEHFDHAVGLDQLPAEAHRSLRLDSSFDFDNHMGVVVCRDLPQPNDQRYLDALEDLLFDVHVAMGGSVLTLFTNRREMERVYDGLRPRLVAAGLDVACQERGSSPRRLRQRFLEERHLSLLALRSFWEGFDAAGDTLRCVVITKLPFASPRDPLVRERELREDRSWWRHSLPEAVISVKQAAGRLIRTSSDTGVLVLADSRLVTKRYGRQFVGSLPSKSVATLEAANVRRYIEMWRSSRGV